MKYIKRIWFATLALPACFLLLPFYGYTQTVKGLMKGEFDDTDWWKIW